MAHARKPDLPTVVDPFTGETRVLGTLPSDPRLVSALPTWATVGDVLPESELEDFDEWPDAIKIKDQNGKGACNWHAEALACELARYMQGQDHVPLSGWYGYAILCNGIDRGSNILEGMALGTEDGNSPESLMPYGEINPRRIPAAAREAASRFRFEIAARLTTWGQVISAVMLRRPLVMPVRAGGRNFNNLDSEGVVGLDQGEGDHAVCVGFGLKKSRRWGWVAKLNNSWTPAWGRGGHGYIAEAHIQTQRYLEIYEVSAVVEDPLDPENPPIARALAGLSRRRLGWTPPEMIG